jgi:hypothetical protein
MRPKTDILSKTLPFACLNHFNKVDSPLTCLFNLIIGIESNSSPYIFKELIVVRAGLDSAIQDVRFVQLSHISLVSAHNIVFDIPPPDYIKNNAKIITNFELTSTKLEINICIITKDFVYLWSKI